MNKTMHKTLRSNWQSQVFKKPKTSGIVNVNRSLGRNTPQKVEKYKGTFLSNPLQTPSKGSYLY